MKTSRTANGTNWTRRIAVAALAGLLVSGGVYVLAGAQREYRAQNKAFMRMKLAWADGVLEGLTLEKFDQVSRNALRLRDLTHSNLWYSMRQPEYMRLTTNFQHSAEGVYSAAVDKNLEAATEAYTKMTRACIDCHHLVRVEQRGKGTVTPAVKPSPSRASEGPR